MLYSIREADQVRLEIASYGSQASSVMLRMTHVTQLSMTKTCRSAARYQGPATVLGKGRMCAIIHVQGRG
jgi:hypothetical protein